MFLGATLVGVHMALTHGVSLAMVSSYIPTTTVPGIGRITGTCWSFTDFVFGEQLCLEQLALQCIELMSLGFKLFMVIQACLLPWLPKT